MIRAAPALVETPKLELSASLTGVLKLTVLNILKKSALIVKRILSFIGKRFKRVKSNFENLGPRKVLRETFP